MTTVSDARDALWLDQKHPLVTVRTDCAGSTMIVVSLQLSASFENRSPSASKARPTTCEKG